MPEPPPGSGELVLSGASVQWWHRGTLAQRPLFLCAHGAGAPSGSPFMQALGTGLEARGVAVLHFDFPYATRSGRAGRRFPPDRPAVLLAACQAVLQLARGWTGGDYGPTHCVVGGKSMGGRMWSVLLAEGAAPGVSAALYFGYPLHPGRRYDVLRADHLQRVRVPQLFISGSRDPLARLDLLQRVVAALPLAQLHVVDGGDHSLARQRRDPFAGSDIWLDAAARFIHAAPPA